MGSRKRVNRKHRRAVRGALRARAGKAAGRTARVHKARNPKGRGGRGKGPCG